MCVCVFCWCGDLVVVVEFSVSKKSFVFVQGALMSANADNR